MHYSLTQQRRSQNGNRLAKGVSCYGFVVAVSLEIVGRVLAGTNPLFRPPLPANMPYEDLHIVMKMCWKEIPDDRPDFSELRKLLKKLHGGK